MKKQLLLLSLLLSTVISAFSTEVEIGGLWYDVITKGNIATVIQYKNNVKYTGDIVIPETVEYNDVSYSVTSIGESAFSNCSGLTSVTIPNSVTSIGEIAFRSSSDLISVTIGNSVTRIEGCAFYECRGLTSVTIPNSVTSIGVWAFYGCSRLTSVTIGNSVTSIEGYAFYECSRLASITIPNSVTNIADAAFSNCSGLTSVTIGSGIKYIGSSAFAKCEGLTDVYCYAESVPTTGSNAFANSYIEYTTLHVPMASIDAYKAAEPWSGFKTIMGLDGTLPDNPEPETKKCATPTISLVNGELEFSCETEDVEYVSEVTVDDSKKYYDSKVSLTGVYKVSVYAVKSGYDNSDVATAEFTMGSSGIKGDMNEDGKVNGTDIQTVINIIVNEE